MEKLCWKGSMTADMPSRASYLVYIEWRVNLSQLSQIMTFIEYFLQILRSYFTPYKHRDFTGTVLWYYITDPGLPVLWNVTKTTSTTVFVWEF